MNISRVDVFAALPARLGDRATDAAAIREAHGRSESYHAAHMPDLVVFPESAAEVVDIVKICGPARIPLVGFGPADAIEAGSHHNLRSTRTIEDTIHKQIEMKGKIFLLVRGFVKMASSQDSVKSVGFHLETNTDCARRSHASTS